MNKIVNEISVTSDAEILKNLEAMINAKLKTLEVMKEEKKKVREMLDDGCTGNPTYREHAQKAKEAAKVKARTKQQILAQPSMLALSGQLKGIARGLKETKLALSDYLLEYQRLSGGVTQLELFDNTTVSIVNSAKVVRHK